MTAEDRSANARRNRWMAILLLQAGAAVAGVSLIPVLSPWAYPPSDPAATYHAFSGWPGLMIVTLIPILLVAAVQMWTDETRVTGMWGVTLACGLIITATGAFAGLGGRWIFPGASPEGGSQGLLLLVVPGEAPSPAYGTWLAAAGGVLAVAASAFARFSSASRRGEEGRQATGRSGWSPVVVAAGFVGLAGGVIGASHLAGTGGPFAGGLYSLYLTLPLVIILSTSPHVWRSAAALGAVAAGTLLVATVVIGYPFDLLSLGALIAAAGSGVALFAPVDRLRVSGGIFRAATSTRFLAGAVVFALLAVAIVQVGLTSGSV